jgi:hypothetical protein
MQSYSAMKRVGSEEIPREGILKERVIWVWVSLVALIGGADYLMYGQPAGVGMGVFFAGFALLILCHGELRNRTTGVVAVLTMIAVALIETAIEVCFTNVAVLISLLVALKGLAGPGRESSAWIWGASALESLIRPLRGCSILYRELEMALAARGGGVPEKVLRALRLVLPVAALAGLFALLLGTGNRIFGNLLKDSFAWVSDILLIFREVTFWRVLCWCLFATMGLSAFLPPETMKDCWWRRPVARFGQPNEFGARFLQTFGLLVAVNLIFLVSNGMDFAYLWMGRQLPAGVTYAAYVHRGVFSLMTAVVLAAVVIVAVFQQSEEVVGRRGVRAVASIWIAQNLFLVVSVLLRLKLYTDAYWLTPKRIYVCVFLLIVSTGFILLLNFIHLRRNLSLLIRANLVVVFTVFYMVQFADVNRWVASYNLDQWMESPKRELGDTYFRQLGPAGWPAMIAMVESGLQSPAVDTARCRLGEQFALESHSNKFSSWQAFQFRRERLRKELLESGPYTEWKRPGR